jgi:hypothetical protein
VALAHAFCPGHDDSFIKATSSRDAEVNAHRSELAGVRRRLDKTSEQIRYAVNEIDRLHAAFVSERERSRSPHRRAPASLILAALALPFAPGLTDAGSYRRPHHYLFVSSPTASSPGLTAFIYFPHQFINVYPSKWSPVL